MHFLSKKLSAVCQRVWFLLKDLVSHLCPNCLHSDHIKEVKIVAFKKGGHFMQVESNAENSNKTFLLYFQPAITLIPPNKFSSTKFLVCFNIQSASMSLKVCENVVRVSNSLDPDETPSYSASHLDPSCLHMELKLCLAV